MVESVVVHKYGGTSVGSIERIARVANHIVETVHSGSRLVVVVSAMGSCTDELISWAERLSPHPPKREMDMLLTAGERISMALLSIAIQRQGISAISLTGSQCGILTDDTHGSARITRILGDRIRDGLLKNDVVIVAGFQGVSPVTKEITTLGRGGSDLTAVAVAQALGAKKCRIFTDVDGVYSAHPNVVVNARLLPYIPWDQMAEMAWSGASVLHHRAASLAYKYQIPVEVRSSLHFNNPGTFIAGKNIMEEASVTAITHKERQAFARILITPQPEKLMSRTLTWLRSNDESPVMLKVGHTSSNCSQIDLVIRSTLVRPFVQFLRDSYADLALSCELSATEEIGVVTLVGSNFRHHPEFLFEVEDQMREHRIFFINCRETTIDVGVNAHEVPVVLTLLHSHFIERHKMS